MADNIEQNDDLNLDDFNFDDILAETDEADSKAGASDDNMNFDFDDIANTDFNFDKTLSESSMEEKALSEDSDVESPLKDVMPDERINSDNQQPDILPETEEKEAGSEIFDAVSDTESEIITENAAAAVTEEIPDEGVFDAAEQNLEREALDVSDGGLDENLVEPVQETLAEENVVDTVLPPEQDGDEADENLAEREEYFSDSASVDAGDIVDDYPYASDYSAVSGIEEVKNAGFLKWYSGSSSEKMVEISKGFESGTFAADEERKTIHVNVGYDMYGWEVQFSDGTVMNLRDVREYQIRNGRLPSPDGKLVYGQSALLFSGVERIVVYESVRYFSYGI